MQHHGARGAENRPNGTAFYGSNGAVIADRLSYEVLPEPQAHVSPYQTRLEPPASEALSRMHKNGPEPSPQHAARFIRCIRDGEQPLANAVTGHRASLVAHLGNIAYKVGRKLRWGSRQRGLRRRA